MTEIEKAYVAGFIDGEGSVCLSRNRKIENRIPVVQATSTTRELLEFLQGALGGNIRVQKTYKKHHKQAWVWGARRHEAVDALVKIVPYMREPKKIARAKLLINEWTETVVKNGKYSEEQKAAKEDFERRFFAI